MKRIMTLILAAGLVFGATVSANAVDFQAKGQWIFGFGVADSDFVKKVNGKRTSASASDKFDAMQRVRLQMTAVASESLSGTVYFEIGDQVWGRGSDGAALGADGVRVEVKRAYIDWTVPNTDLSLRMGIQGFTLPNAAGGSAVLDDDAAGIVASYKINDNVALTAMWVRPVNDNFAGDSRDPQGYLDNVDLFGLAVPLTFDGVKVTPWVLGGMAGRNSLYDLNGVGSTDYMISGLIPPAYWNGMTGNEKFNGMAYGTVIFAGLPIEITAFDPLKIEFDLNYGYSSGLGRYDNVSFKDGSVRRAETKREGWLAKALVEYKLDWGVPGLFGWYASGDDGSVKNGSERMPAISPCTNFTSFIGDGADRGWSIHNGGWANAGYDLMLTYSGTWGIGFQLRDMSFLEDLTHTFRVAYWGGTNAPSMAKYMGIDDATSNAAATSEGFYLTTNDGLVEFNLDSTYKIYDNLTATLELGYIVNCVDKDTWNRYYRESSFTKGDAYKAALIFNYSF